MGRGPAWRGAGSRRDGFHHCPGRPDCHRPSLFRQAPLSPSEKLRLPTGQTQGELARKPSNLSFEEAASVPVASQTAWQGVFTHGHLEKGQTILIHGGAGAVGAYAVQLASHAGATVLATASATMRRTSTPSEPAGSS